MKYRASSKPSAAFKPPSKIPSIGSLEQLCASNAVTLVGDLREDFPNDIIDIFGVSNDVEYTPGLIPLLLTSVQTAYVSLRDTWDK